MNRRVFIRASSGWVVALSLSALGQQLSSRVVRIGVLSPSNAPMGRDDAIRALGEFGYIEGRNTVVEYRWAEQKIERLPNLASDLVRLKVDVIVARGSEATQAARQATSSIPIVSLSGDPVAAGFVASLARPGGNITGVSGQISDLAPKYIELLKELLPDLSEVAVLWSPSNASSARLVRELNDAAAHFRATIRAFPTANRDELDRALDSIQRARLRAMIVPAIPVMLGNGARIGEFAIRNQVVALSLDDGLVEETGLLLYHGPTSAEGWTQIAAYVDKILRGAKPADLPVQQGVRVGTVINLKTAKSLGITIPQSLVSRAEAVIQ